MSTMCTLSTLELTANRSRFCQIISTRRQMWCEGNQMTKALLIGVLVTQVALSIMAMRTCSEHDSRATKRCPDFFWMGRAIEEQQRSNRLAKDSTLLANRFNECLHPKNEMILVACGDTIWTTGCHNGGADSVHCADNEKFLHDVNVRLMRFVGDSIARSR